MNAAMLALALALEPPRPALAAGCFGAARLAAAPGLAAEAGERTFALGASGRCRWLVGQDVPTAGLLLRLADSLPAPRWLEVATTLDATSALAAHVALLDARGRPERIAPWTSFRERRGERVLRFVLRPEDVPGYLWIGAAPDAWPHIARRTFRGASTRVLAVIGLETGGDRSTLVASRTTGTVTVRVAPLGEH